jgi:hypothetical protein
MNEIYNITANKNTKLSEGYIFARYEDMTIHECNITLMVWRLSNNINEFESNMNLDIKDIYRYYTYKLLNEYSGEKIGK